MADAAIRYELVTYLDIGTAPTVTYTLMGEGFKSIEDSQNPETDSVVYVSDIAATKSLKSYAPEFSFEGDIIKDNTVIEFLRNKGKTQAVGSDAETTIVSYDVWEEVANEVPAIQYAVAVAMDTLGGGEGGEKAGFSGTLLGIGDAVQGTFNTSTHVFTADVS
jgi:hypothetical protein